MNDLSQLKAQKLHLACIIFVNHILKFQTGVIFFSNMWILCHSWIYLDMEQSCKILTWI